MTTNDRTRISLRRLARSLSLTWAAAWLAGLGLLAAVAIDQGSQLQTQDLDAQLALHGMAVYGLGWYDGTGHYHAEMVLREPAIAESKFDIWVVQPGTPPRVNLSPETPRFLVPGLHEIAARAQQTQQDLFADVTTADGTALRVHAGPTFPEDDDTRANGAVVIVADSAAARSEQSAFTTRLLLFTAVLGVLGLAVGVVLSQRSLRPVARALDQRERFVAAAAHELRSPVASLVAVCDSARAGDEPATEALARVAGLAEQTSRVVNDLLLYARLDAGGAAMSREPVRLDLLVETCLPEDSSVVLVSGDPVTLPLDAVLVATAVRLVLANAQRHGGPADQHIVVTVTAHGVTVEDQGPGFPQTVLGQSRQVFSLLPSSSGAGLGLAITRMIAEVHGGALLLENRPEGGARVTLHLAPGQHA